MVERIGEEMGRRKGWKVKTVRDMGTIGLWTE
jgi:hypothetical protein